MWTLNDLLGVHTDPIDTWFIHWNMDVIAEFPARWQITRN